MAQEKTGFLPDFKLSENTSVSSGNDLPFWMITNQNGVFALHNSSYLLLQAGINRGLERDTLKKWGYTYGTNMVYGIAGTSDFHPNPAHAHSRQVKVMPALPISNPTPAHAGLDLVQLQQLIFKAGL